MRHACEVTVNKFICVVLGLKEFKFSCEGSVLDLEEFCFLYLGYRAVDVEILVSLCFKVYNLLKFYSLQLKVVPYMSEICLLMQHPQNSRKHLKNLDLLRRMASKSEATRFALCYILCVYTHIKFAGIMLMSRIFIFCSKDIVLVLLHLRHRARCRVHLRYFHLYLLPCYYKLCLVFTTPVSLALKFKFLLNLYNVLFLVSCADFLFLDFFFSLFSDLVVFHFASCFCSFSIKSKKFFSVLPIEKISRIYLMSSSGTIPAILH